MTVVIRPEGSVCARASRWYEGTKRAIDITVSVTVLIALLPLWLLIALAIRATSPGPVLYRAEVAGRGGRPFAYFKFRSMHANADDGVQRRFRRDFVRENKPYLVERTPDGAERPVYKVVGDPRITPVGLLIRRCSLDEVPQLLNVLRGEMSIVGPRPPLLWEVQYYQDWHWERLSAKPGLTGAAQIRSRQGLPFDEMARIDIDYVRRRSLLRDLAILLATPFAMLRDLGRN
ncbi:MAG: sugar transferase [Dehalococcoidia bacterium]|nr:sugar transferase [Dehalococcoidia bacterium]